MRWPDWAVRTGYALRVNHRRAHNRVFDVVGRAAGFCMQDCWQATTASWGAGFPHWRCWTLRRAHPPGWHRTGNYRWLEGGAPMYDPLPVSWETAGGPVPGRAPRWLSGRHFDVPRRGLERRWLRRQRELRQAAEQAAEQARRETTLRMRATALASMGLPWDQKYRLITAMSNPRCICDRPVVEGPCPRHAVDAYLRFVASRHDTHLHTGKTEDESETSE